MQENDTFIVSIGDFKIEVSKQITKVSLYFHNILSLGFDQEEIQLELIDSQTFLSFLKFCSINNYTEPSIRTPIRTNQLSEVLDQKNFNFIKEFPIKSKQFTELLKAAEFLACKGLQRLCASVYACMLYFQDCKEAYQNKMKELQITKKLTFDDEEKFRKLYLYM